MLRLRRIGIIRALAAALGVTALALTAACGSSGGSTSPDNGGTQAQSGSSPSTSGAIDKHLAGQEITILMPPWADMGADKYKEFTQATGIKVKLDIEQFDQVHDKVVTAMTAGVAPADVIEVDSLWVGQFGKAKWLTPLKPYINPSYLANVGAKTIFQLDGKQVAMPYALDFRWIKVNMTLLEKAGITTAPGSWTELLDAAKKVKSAGVAEYPIGMPLSVTAETVEPWLNLGEMDGGQILSSDGSSPAFNDPSSPLYKSLAFLRSAYEAKLINPGYANVQGEQVQKDFAAGKVVFDMRNGPSIVYNNPKTSRVASDKFADIVIGENGPANKVYGLPEGMGIPTTSKHQDAAAMFINWYNAPANEVFMYSHQIPGVLPAQPDALSELVSKGTLPNGETVMKILPGVIPLFPQGAPTWWPTFANDAAAVVQSVVLGHSSVADGLNKLADQTKSLASD